MPGVSARRSLVLIGLTVAIAVLSAACTAASAIRPSPSPTATKSPDPSPTATPTDTTSPSAQATATPTPTTTPDGTDPSFIPALAAIQMLTPRLGWAVGSGAIFTTTDGVHWSKPYSSTNEYVGLDFISTTTGWVVGLHDLLGTTDGGRSWHELGEAPKPIRSVHFVSATQGWGIAGGGGAQLFHGGLMPASAGTLVMSTDGGHSWTNLNSPSDPQAVCFSDPSHGWLATANATIYASHDAGQTWTPALQMYGHDQGLPSLVRIECSAPSALWILLATGNGAAGHSPYIAYATANGTSWRTVMAEPGTIGNLMPGVPAGPDTHPGSMSVIDSSDAVFVGDGPATNVAACVIATQGGATLKRTGAIPDAPETFDAAFLSTSAGWVLARHTTGEFVIEATADGGYHWTQQLSVTVPSPG
jgi:photosystem II stability/assembly factor-like uncharacterized protein